MRLSKHFRQKWFDFFGCEPDEASINRMINESLVVQEFKQVFTNTGVPWNVAKICWHRQSNILFKIDENSQTVITFVAARRPFKRFKGGDLWQGRAVMR